MPGAELSTPSGSVANWRSVMGRRWLLGKCLLAETVSRPDLPQYVVSPTKKDLSGVVLLPWTIRNYQVYHGFVAVATNAGGNFYYGNSPYTIPFLRAGYHPQWIPSQLDGQHLDSREANAKFMELGLQYLRDNPAKIPELLWVKFLAYWSIDVFPTRNPVSGMTPVVDYNGTVHLVTDSQGGIDLTGVPDVVFTSSDPTKVQIIGGGDLRLQAVGTGSANIIASYGGLNATGQVTVISAPALRIAHRYSFRGNASDSVGHADGTLRGFASIVTNAVVLTGANNPVTHVQLPSDLISGYNQIGTFLTNSPIMNPTKSSG